MSEDSRLINWPPNRRSLLRSGGLLFLDDGISWFAHFIYDFKDLLDLFVGESWLHWSVLSVARTLSNDGGDSGAQVKRRAHRLELPELFGTFDRLCVAIVVIEPWELPPGVSAIETDCLRQHRVEIAPPMGSNCRAISRRLFDRSGGRSRLVVSSGRRRPLCRFRSRMGQHVG